MIRQVYWARKTCTTHDGEPRMKGSMATKKKKEKGGGAIGPDGAG